jgi:glutamyl-tRNA synthetase
MDGRFAPSPTGPLHLGNLRTALLAWLFARHAGSRFLLRVEDLDPVASRAELVAGQLGDLAALGLDHDGPIVHQSDRGAAYDAAIDRLDAAGLLYPCFCTRKEIAAAAQAPHGPELAYPGTCRGRTDRPARAPAWRVAAGGASVTFVDRVCGPTTAVVDDFIVRRRDGGAAYNLAVVVDDAFQGVDEVVRGDDLLAGTGRQLWLSDQLGLPRPAHAHVPLVLGPDGERLAKRHGAVTLAEAGGPAAVLSLLGSSLGLCAAAEPVVARRLLTRFDPATVPRTPWTWPTA